MLEFRNADLIIVVDDVIHLELPEDQTRLANEICPFTNTGNAVPFTNGRFAWKDSSSGVERFSIEIKNPSNPGVPLCRAMLVKQFDGPAKRVISRINVRCDNFNSFNEPRNSNCAGQFPSGFCGQFVDDGSITVYRFECDSSGCTVVFPSSNVPYVVTVHELN